MSIWRDKIGIYNKFVGISDWPPEAQRITQIFGFVKIIYWFIVSLTSTFLILYILDALGFKTASIVITIMVSFQIAADYPTGALSDYVGQRLVLGSAIFLLSIGVFLLAYATTLLYFIISAAIIGIANAQVSGALESWYDNNYLKFNIHDDLEKKEYGYTLNQITAIQNFVMGVSFILGGILATVYSRANVFIIEAIIGVILAIYIFNYLKDINGEIPSKIQELSSKSNFVDSFKGGIVYIFGSRTNVLIALGYTLILFVVTLWLNLILLPLYFGYSGSDKIAGLLRSIIFFIQVGTTIIISNLSRRINKNNVALFFGLWQIGISVGVILLLYFVPMKNQFSLIGFITIIVLFTLTVSSMGGIAILLMQRIILNFFPSEYRNSLYSFFPTAQGILAIFLLPLTGSLIQSGGLIAGVGMGLILAIIGTIALEIGVRSLKAKEIVIERNQKTSAILVAD